MECLWCYVQVLKKYDSGETGNIYMEKQWQQELVEFTDYGPGLRRISLQSYGESLTLGSPSGLMVSPLPWDNKTSARYYHEQASLCGFPAMFLKLSPPFPPPGKDDKFWAGSYGPVISDATVRVKRETRVAEDDAFVDVNLVSNRFSPLVVPVFRGEVGRGYCRLFFVLSFLTFLPLCSLSTVSNSFYLLRHCPTTLSNISICKSSYS